MANKALADGDHSLPCGAVATVVAGKPVAVLLNGADIDTATEEVESLTRTWVEFLEERRASEPCQVKLTRRQPTHVFKRADGADELVFCRTEHDAYVQGSLPPTANRRAEALYEEGFPPYLDDDGAWRDSSNDEPIPGARLEPI
jgi:hypothetical protein